MRTNAPEGRGVLSRDQLIPGQRVFTDQYVSSAVGKNFNGRNGRQNANASFTGGTIFCDAASSYISIKHQLGFTANETVCSLLAFEREAEDAKVTVTGCNSDNGVHTAKELTVKLQESKQTIRMSGVGAHHQNGPAENTIKNVTRRARIFMFHAALHWPEKFDKTL